MAQVNERSSQDNSQPSIINDYSTSPNGNIIATSSALEILSTTTYAASLKERPESLYPLDIPPRPTEQDVPATPQGIILLASVGAWKSVIKVADKCISNMERPGLPHILLQLRQSKIVALIMIRSYKIANEELSALGNLDDPIYHFESYPSIYPDLKGSFVSFSLRLIQAELPSYLGNIGQTMDLLYHIQKRCRQEIKNEIKLKLNNNDPNFENIDLDKLFGPAPPLPGSLLFNESIDPNAFWDPTPKNFVRGINDWRYRECWVTLIIATHLVKQKEYILALTIVEDISQKYPKDNILKSSVGRLYIQIGFLSRARDIFTEIEQSVGEKNPLILMNRALLCVSEEKYEEAKECFCLLLLKDPNNCLAANNLAVCYLYTCHLIKAMHLLEDLIRKDPIKNLQESIVFNLCSLYDLYSDNTLEKKTQIMKLVSQYGNDGFDYSMLKLPFPNNPSS